MNDSPLKSRLIPVMRRQRWLRVARATAVVWLALTLVMGLVWLAMRSLGVGSPLTVPILGVVSLGVTLGCWWREARRVVSVRAAADAVEAAFPELNSLVRTASQLTPEPGSPLPPLQQRVVTRALAHDAQHDWRTAVPGRRLLATALLPVFALLLVMATLRLNYTPFVRRMESTKSPLLVRSGVEVTPGNVELEKGESLIVLARFGGEVPKDAELVVRPRQGPVQRSALKRNLQDPVFGGSLREVGENLSYHVEYAGQSTAEYQVTVYEHPRLERADAELTYPAYTRLATKRIDDTKRLSAIEGTRVNWWLNLNKPVKSAQLVPRGTNQPVLTLQTGTNRAMVELAQHVLTASATYDLRLVDADGRTNKVSSVFVMEALKNRIPEMRLASPKGDVKPSPLEELHFEGTVWDDFGIPAFGIAYTVAGGEVRMIELGTNLPAQTKTPFQFDLRLEELGLHPDQLLAWFVWAEDLGPDGQVRRNQGDMFFGEVRPFETVFREGEGGGGEGGEGAGGGGMKKLAELQKQILSATWKLQREYSGPRGGSGTPPAMEAKPATAPEKPRATSGSWTAPNQGPGRLLSAEFREKWLHLQPDWAAQVRDDTTPAPVRAPRSSGTPIRRSGASASPTAARPAGPVSFAEDLKVICDGM